MTVKQPIGLRDWHSAINKALYPFKGRDQEADNKITRQISRFQSLDPEERNATDVEQIYQVGIHEPHHDPGDRVSAKRTKFRYISRRDVALRLVFLGQIHMVIIDHIIWSIYLKISFQCAPTRVKKFIW